MAHSADPSINRTSMWLNNNVKPDPVEDVDVPLDFSSKKRHTSDDMDDQDTASDGGASSTASSRNGAESPPASMVAANGHINPLLRLPNAATMGSFFPNGQTLPSFAFPASLMDHQTRSTKSSTKPVRPFKAYPRDPLSLPLGLYGFPMGLGLSTSVLDSMTPQMFGGSKDAYMQYKRSAEAMFSSKKNGSPVNTPTSPTVAPAPTKSSRKSTPKHVRVDTTVAMNGVVSSSVRPSQSSTKSEHSPLSVASAGSPNSAAVVDSTAGTANSSPAITEGNGHDRSESKTPDGTLLADDENGHKKRARSVPDEIKDEAYWERRRKNNEAAKRSRDARRAKEDDIALRAAFLENENVQLRVQVAQLKNETEKLRCMLFNS